MSPLSSVSGLSSPSSMAEPSNLQSISANDLSTSVSKIHTVTSLMGMSDNRSSSSEVVATTTASRIGAPVLRSKEEEFQRRMLEVFSNKSPLPIQSLKNDPLRQLFNEGLKGDSAAMPLDDAYGEQYLLHLTETRLASIEKLAFQVSGNGHPYITTDAEREGVFRLYQHRANMLRLTTNLYGKGELNLLQLDQITQEIQDNIDSLDDMTSNQVLVLEDGSTCFSFYGRCQNEEGGHAVSYEFKKMGSDYIFIIHNRGAGRDEIGDKMHGKHQYTIDDKIYERTSIPIKVSKEQLKDSNFIQKLITVSENIPYAFIHQHLIDQGGGQILKTESETLVEQLQAYLSLDDAFLNSSLKETIKNLMEQLIKSDKNIHSRQLFSTCTVSNITELEKELAPPSVIRFAKLFSTRELVSQLEERIRAPPAPQDAIHFYKRNNKANSLVKTFAEYTKDARFAIDLSRNKEAKLHKKLAEKAPEVDVPAAIEKAKLALTNASELLKEKAGKYSSLSEQERLSFIQFFSADIHKNKGIFSLPDLGIDLSENKEFILDLVKANKVNFDDIPKEKVTSEILRAAVKNKGELIEFIPKDDPDYGALALDAVRNNPEFAMIYIPNTRSDYVTLVLEAVRNNTMAFFWVNENLSNYRELVLEAVKVNPQIFVLVPKTLPGYEALQLEVVKSNYRALEFMTDSPNFSELLSEAVNIDAEAFKFAPIDRSDYRELALKSMKKNGGALQYVPTDRADYFEIAFAAVNNESNAIIYVPKERPDYEILLAEADRHQLED